MVQAFRVSRPLWMTEDGEVEEGKLPSLAMQDFARPPPDAPALLVFTSGSTATPRGVIQTHANIHANTAAICDYLALTPEDRACCILPFYYCYGKSVLQTHLYCGGSVFLDHRFMYPRVVMEAIASERCTGFAGVPLTFELLRRQAAMAGLSLSALRYVTQAGGGMTLETQRWVRETFAPAKLFVMYGQTEATARLTYLPPERAEEKEGSVGIPVQGVTVSILDDDGRVLEPRHTGNVVAQGPSITPGYWHAPEETAAVFKKGRLWTGDLGFLDKDGFLFLTGRAKDMLKISGHRVSALEIEQGLTAHPEVHEAAVLRTEDALGGEAAAAFVVLRKGGQVTELELKKYCREHLPPYKVPASIQFLDALPRSGAGKVQKAQLTALLPKDTP